jgi:hypothetical protein
MNPKAAARDAYKKMASGILTGRSMSVNIFVIITIAMMK